MGSKVVRTNFRVEVVPRDKGDYGAFRTNMFGQHTAGEAEKLCEGIASDIRRHVDGLPSYGSRGVSVVWDSQKVCEHCGDAWTEDAEVHNGGCCAKDCEALEAAEAAAEAERATHPKEHGYRVSPGVNVTELD